jgi:hypothetical protein
VTNSHARQSNASPIATDMSRLANISPTSSTRTGSRSGSSQFAPHAVMYETPILIAAILRRAIGCTRRDQTGGAGRQPLCASIRAEASP